MDPDTCLEELRKAIESAKVEISKGFDGDLGDDVDTIIVKFEALDGWLSAGGFRPKAWRGQENKP